MRPSSDGVCRCCHGRSFRILNFSQLCERQDPRCPFQAKRQMASNSKSLAENHKPRDSLIAPSYVRKQI
jgi:hypothetical protein